jgi:hypothetical protein
MTRGVASQRVIIRCIYKEEWSVAFIKAEALGYSKGMGILVLLLWLIREGSGVVRVQVVVAEIKSKPLV